MSTNAFLLPIATSKKTPELHRLAKFSFTKTFIKIDNGHNDFHFVGGCNPILRTIVILQCCEIQILTFNIISRFNFVVNCDFLRNLTIYIKRNPSSPQRARFYFVAGRLVI